MIGKINHSFPFTVKEKSYFKNSQSLTKICQRHVFCLFVVGMCAREESKNIECIY